MAIILGVIFLKKINNEKGQALIELALTLPILILILGGIVDFGWIFTNQNIVDHLAREGARYAVVHSTDTNAIKNYTKSLTTSNISTTLNVAVTFSNTYNRRLGDVTVSVTGAVKVLTPITGIFTNGQAINLDSTCRMKVE
jgi:Flp pilus assembly protein TadG